MADSVTHNHRPSLLGKNTAAAEVTLVSDNNIIADLRTGVKATDTSTTIMSCVISDNIVFDLGISIATAIDSPAVSGISSVLDYNVISNSRAPIFTVNSPTVTGNVIADRVVCDARTRIITIYSASIIGAGG